MSGGNAARGRMEPADRKRARGEGDRSRSPGSLAALSICEGLLIALVEKGVLDWDEVSETLEAAVDAHRNADPDRAGGGHDRAAREILNLLHKLNGLRAINMA